MALVGGVLLMAEMRQQVSLEILVLEAECAVTLAGVDIGYVAKRVVRPVYLWDAAAEIGLALAWVLSAMAQT